MENCFLSKKVHGSWDGKVHTELCVLTVVFGSNATAIDIEANYVDGKPTEGGVRVGALYSATHIVKLFSERMVYDMSDFPEELTLALKRKLSDLDLLYLWGNPDANNGE